MEPSRILFALFLAKAGILFLFLMLTAIGVYTVFRQQVPNREYHAILFGVSLIVGPILMSWVLTFLLYFLPGMPRGFYVYAPVALFLPFAIVGIKNFFADVIEFSKSAKANPTKVRYSWLFFFPIVALIIFSLGGLVATNAMTPLHGNDALEYSRLARVIAEHRSAQIYPIVDSSFSDGFVASWTHPMGYINLLTYSYLLQGNLDTSGIGRFIAPYFAFATTVLMIAFAGFGRKLSGLFAAFFLLSTPLYYGLVVQCHIDPTRIAAFTAAIASIWLATREPNLKIAVIAGIACGCSMFSHSIGILTLPLAIPVYIILAARRPLKTHILNLFIIAGLALTMVALRYTINLRSFGSFISDSVEIWEMPELGVEYARNVTRFMASPLDRIFNGAFMGFTNTSLFGWSYYLLLVAILILLFKTRAYIKVPIKTFKVQAWRDDQGTTNAALLVVLGYAGIIFLTLFMGTDLAVKNARYILTLQPFVIIVAVRVLAQVFLNDVDRIR